LTFTIPHINQTTNMLGRIALQASAVGGRLKPEVARCLTSGLAQQHRRKMSTDGDGQLLRVELCASSGAKNIIMCAPKTRNSLSMEMLHRLHGEISSDVIGKEVRSIVLRGEGKAFSAGHNLKEMTVQEGSQYHQQIFDACNRLMLAMAKSPVPVIAVVDGVAAAAGCQLVAMCDIAVATQKSSFSVPGSAVGIFCSTPGIPLARMVPRKTSAYMLMTGNPISAEEALRTGLISKMAADSESLEAEVGSICEAIASKPRGVVALGKRFFYKQLEMGLSEALQEGGQVMVDNLKYRDAQEGIAAFKEKRKPVWSHTDEKVL